MPPPQVIVDHDQLDLVQRILAGQADAVGELIRSVKSSYDPLRNGGWIGLGANAFFQEMEDMVFPVLQRLEYALAQSARLTGQYSKIFLEAEEEAAKALGTGPQSAGGGAGAGRGTNGAGPAGGVGAGGPGAGGGGSATGVGSGASGTGQAGGGSSPLDVISKINEWARYPRALRTFANMWNAARETVPKWVTFLAKNPVLKAVSRGFSTLNLGLGVVDFVKNPNLQTGADAAVAGIGTYAAFASGSHPLAWSFTFGYFVGQTFVPDSVSDWLGDKLIEWDPLGIID